MASKHNNGERGRAPHTYTVKFPGDVPAPLNVQADRFEIDGDAILFTTGGDVSAVVRGSWTSIVQQPDPVVESPA